MSSDALEEDTRSNKYLLSWPPSLSTTCTNEWWSSGVHRSRGILDLTYCLTVPLLSLPSLEMLLPFPEVPSSFTFSILLSLVVNSYPSSALPLVLSSLQASAFKSNVEHFWEHPDEVSSLLWISCPSDMFTCGCTGFCLQPIDFFRPLQSWNFRSETNRKYFNVQHIKVTWTRMCEPVRTGCNFSTNNYYALNLFK